MVVVRIESGMLRLANGLCSRRCLKVGGGEKKMLKTWRVIASRLEHEVIQMKVSRRDCAERLQISLKGML